MREAAASPRRGAGATFHGDEAAFAAMMRRASALFDGAIAPASPAAADLKRLTWVYHPYDRCTLATGPLAELGPERAGLILVESHSKGVRRPYHKKKLALVLSSGRHLALEAASRGYKVLHLRDHRSFGDGLLMAQAEHGLGEIVAMEPAERELRADLADAAGRGLRMRFVPDTTWLSTAEDFNAAFGMSAGMPAQVQGRLSGDKGKQPVKASFRMDRFYRFMRQKTGLLMTAAGKPVGDHYSFDTENRQPYRGEPPVPQRPSYPPDAITAEVLAFVEQLPPGETFGSGAGFDYPVTEADVQACWRFALEELLPEFGPFEDAMATREPDLFHSKISALMNLGRILPRQLVDQVAEAYAKGRLSLASTEGFVRQILGWREFMRHIHRVTDGYRDLDVFYERKPGNSSAAPSALHATLPLPAAYWGVKSELRCLDTVVAQVIDEGWSHHITRLMVLSNLATLCGFSPRELTDWFWFAYVDAYDWVVEPNVLGMSTYADGGVTATKPYVSGAAYINRMSDYCPQCRFDPKKSLGDDACPFTALYWSFLERNAALLQSNPRLAMPYRTLAKKSASERKELRARAEQAITELEAVPRPEY